MSKITESARGMECQVRMPSICNRDPSTTVWAHANGSAAGKGIGMKAPDFLGAYCCSACHDVYDRRQPVLIEWDTVKGWFYEGVFRSQRLLADKGLLRTGRE